MNQNFNASNLGEINAIIEGPLYDGIRSGNIVSAYIGEWDNSIGNIVKSEDSNLSNTCVNLRNTLLEALTKASKVLNSIKVALAEYAQATIENEQQVSQSLSDINSSLEDINSRIAAI